MKKNVKKLIEIIFILLVSISITACGNSNAGSKDTANLSKGELKKDFFYMEDQLAQVLIDTQKDGMTDSHIKKEIKASKKNVFKKITILKNNKSNTKLTKLLIKYGKYTNLSLQDLVKRMDGNYHQKKHNATYKTGQLSTRISEKYFNGAQSKKLQKMLNVFSEKKSSLNKMTNKTTNDSQKNDDNDDTDASSNNDSETNDYSNSDTLTESKKDEVFERAQNLCNSKDLSEIELRDSLSGEFSQDEIDYAVNKLSKDSLFWNVIASDRAKKYQESDGISSSIIKNSLEEDGFTSDQINYAMQHLDD